MNYNIALLKGDGIGPEIVNEAIKALNKVGELYGHTFNYSEVDIGGCSIDKHGVPITDEGMIAAIEKRFVDTKIYIADGHHRYETAINYRNHLREQGTPVGADSDYIMMMMVEMITSLVKNKKLQLKKLNLQFVKQFYLVNFSQSSVDLLIKTKVFNLC